jgi:valyl-tRNA synthetase
MHNTGRVPFHHVYVHSKILDGKGETMSKSKGNGVDPAEIISKYGADAMRFSLAYMATETQDVRMPVKKEKQADGSLINVSEKFDIGRNLCNKLWNAARFCMGNLENTSAEPWQKDELQLEDRWILHCLAETIEQVDEALEGYRFAEAAGKLYEFFWSRLCDWYLEMIKSRTALDTASGQTARKVLAVVLDHTLRLFHPLIPFITESLWGRLEEVVGQRPFGEVGKPLAVSAWPKARSQWKDPAAGEAMGLLRELIRALRDTRSHHGVTPGKKVELLVVAKGQDKQILEDNQQTICRLAHISELRVASQAQKPPGAASVLAGSLQAFILGIVDPQKELLKLNKQREQLAGRITTTQKKLANENFVERAKPQVVARERENLKAYQKQLLAVDQQIEQID